MPTYTASHSIPLIPTAASAPYILNLALTPSHIAATTSSKSLHLLDPQTFKQTQTFQTGQSLSQLAAHPDHADIFATTGSEEKSVKLWDVRQGKGPIAQWLAEKPILSLALSSSLLATGSELVSAAAHAILYDIRDLPTTTSTPSPLLKLTESHNDDIIQLSFSTPSTRVLLSAGTDGLLNIFNLDVPGLDFSDPEDTALIRTCNLGSPVNTAGWIKNEGVWGASSDEKFAVYELKEGNGDEGLVEGEEWTPGDVRPVLGCRYIVKVVPSLETDGEYWVVSGSMEEAGELSARRVRRKKGEWGFGKEVVRFSGAHGEEVVRDVIWGLGGKVVTGGEDGLVKVWSEEEGDKTDKPGKAKKEKEKERFKPY